MSPDKDGDDDAFSAKSNQSSSAAASSNAEMPAPPDGGWGWFVVFGSFMIHVVGKHVYVSIHIQTTVLVTNSKCILLDLNLQPTGSRIPSECSLSS